MFRSKRWLALVVALLLLGAACGDDDDGADTGAGTDAPAEEGAAQDFTVVVEPKTEEFPTAWIHFFPDTVKIHPGDTIDFEFNFTGEIHTVSSGTLIEEGLEAFEASDPEGPPPPIAEKIPFVFDEEADPSTGANPFVQAASQPCYEEDADPSTVDACENQEQPDTFTGAQRFFNSGVLIEDDPLSVTFGDSIDPGTYTFICLVHGPEMSVAVEVVDAGTEVPSPDEVRQQGEDELQGFVDAMRPQADEVLGITTADAQAGAFPESEDIPTGGINVFPKEISIAAGEKVTWSVNGFHTIAFNAPEDARPPWDFQADGTFDLNEKALFPQNSPEIPAPAGPPPEEEEGPPPTVEVDGGEFDGTSFVNSGAVLDFRQMVYSLTFPEAGTYQYICLVHPDMEGSIKVG